GSVCSTTRARDVLRTRANLARRPLGAAPRGAPGFSGEVHDDGCVIGRLLEPPRRDVDERSGGAGEERARHERVVDAQAMILREGEGPIATPVGCAGPGMYSTEYS